MTVAGKERPGTLKVFGSVVRGYRCATGLSQDQLGEKIPICGSHIGKIERGETRCDRSIAVKLDELFDTKGALPSLWDELVLDAAFPVWFDWPKVETDADFLKSYQCLVVDGLLQTEEYASALLGGDKAATAARLGRQALLSRDDPPPPRLSVLLAESVLRNEVGDRDVMRGQLEHLLALSFSRVSLQIVPGPLHPADTAGAFGLATLPDRSEVAYVATAMRGITTSESDDIRLLSEAYDEIRSRALPVEMSRDLIRRILEEQWT
ncbi:helix-turn-helix transcriptional regulator [Actinoallomurus purpureus]|uniref:helix-turn-helix domain-containing protein n=1 Tax=Actinoallomurus purpureus TaxID=478114 RepID=UPI002093D9A8|nr:helix-turn-helix transcriptional regulator [Actinoallomurus purpureus]MCO6007623.1 helix-turn-helix transcriptional regulator [Actinoallomurus purpureus]